MAQSSGPSSSQSIAFATHTNHGIQIGSNSGTIQTTIHNYDAAGEGNDLLRSLPFAGNAIFDSAAVVGSDTPCLEGTQQHTLTAIQRWAEDPDGEVILWLQGMAGTGKTSVALTVANALNTRDPFTSGAQSVHSAFLGASFFFKQGDATRDNTKALFPTLARCLAEAYPGLKSRIVAAINEKLSIGTKAPQQQFEHLIATPISLLDEHSQVPKRLVIVIDALDECFQEKEVQDLLSMLTPLEALCQVQLRLLITSRSDDHIRLGFRKLPESFYRPLILNKIRASGVVDGKLDDISLYLAHTLTKLAEKYGVEPTWIDEDTIRRLSAKADGLFIYAATACRFLDAEDFTDDEARQDRLELMFDDEAETDAPRQKVDEIYLKVLLFPKLAKSPKRIRDRIFERTGRILGFIAVFLEPVSAKSVEHFVSLSKSALDDSLKRLHSVLSIPPDATSPISLVHLSFRHFLLDEERSKALQFRVQETAMHRGVFERCLDFMSLHLCQDICKLVLPGTLISEVPPDRISRYIPEHLRYACRYWVDHLANLDDDSRREVGLKDGGKVHEFLQKGVLFWLEAMGLIQETPAAILMINRLQAIIDPHPSGRVMLAALVHDAKRFVLSSRWAIDNAPLQIYSSALLFCPRKSIVRSQSLHLMPPWISRQPVVPENWTAELSLFDDQDGDYYGSVAFSPTDSLLAATTESGTTVLWDYVTMTERFRFGPERDTCVAFSRDGRTIATGSRDSIVRVREFEKGTVIELKGHSFVLSVAFSPTMTHILATLASNATLRIWDVTERRTLHVCDTGSSLFANFLSFSPDGKLIATKSPTRMQDAIFGLWSTETGECVEALRRVSDQPDLDPTSVVFTDDETIVSAHDEQGVFVWNAKTGQQQSHFKFDAATIAFSPANRKLVAFGTIHGAVELRETGSWKVAARFHSGHLIQAISWCRDGKLLALAGRGVRIWDTENNALVVGHGNQGEPIQTVQFLPGCGDSVITSSPNKAELWHADDPSGLGEDGLRLQTSRVRNVHISPDGNIVAILMADSCQLWDKGISIKLAEFPQNRLELTRAKFSPDSKYMAMPEDVAMVRVIDCSTFKTLAVLPAIITFSPVGHLGAVRLLDISGKNSSQIQLWDLATETVLASLPWNDGGIFRKISFSPDGQLVASQDHEGNFQLFETTRGEESGPFLTTSAVTRIAFHPDGHLIATAEKDDENIQVVIWETVTATASEKFRFHVNTDDGNCEIHSMQISAAGVLLLWNTSTGVRVGSYRPRWWEPYPNPWISFASISSDSRHLESPIGRLPLRSREDNDDEETREAAQHCLYVLGPWVFQGHERLLWLPMELRTSQLALKGELFALACGDVVRFIGFDLSKSPISSRGGRAV